MPPLLIDNLQHISNIENIGMIIYEFVIILFVLIKKVKNRVDIFIIRAIIRITIRVQTRTSRYG